MKYNYTYSYRETLNMNDFQSIAVISTFDTKGNIRIDYVKIEENDEYITLKVVNVEKQVEKNGILISYCRVILHDREIILPVYFDIYNHIFCIKRKIPI